VHRTGGGLFRGTVFLGCPVTTEPSGSAEGASDTFGLQGRGKGHQWTPASGTAGGMGHQAAALTGRQRRGCLAFQSFRTYFFWFPSCFGEGEKEKQAPCRYRPCYGAQQVPCQGMLSQH